MIKQQQDQLRQEYEGKLANLEREREGIGRCRIHLSCLCFAVSAFVCLQQQLFD